MGSLTQARRTRPNRQTKREEKRREEKRKGKERRKSLGRMSWLVFAADAAPAAMKLHHATNIALAGLTPAAVLLPEGNVFIKPVDVALGVALPLHSHITCNMVISDYVPPAARGIARGGMAGLTAVAVLGLLKVNLMGPGITSVVRQLWKKDEKLSK